VFSVGINDFYSNGKSDSKNYADSTGSSEHTAKFGPFDPNLVIAGDLPSINCHSTGSIEFYIKVENVFTNFNITSVEAYVESANTRDVSNMISCSPMNNLKSGSGIKCSLNLNQLLSIGIPCLPDGRIDNKFKIKLTLQKPDGGQISLPASKSFIITETEVEPNLTVNVISPTPPILNCLTGTKIRIDSTINHAEVISKDVDWWFKVNNTDDKNTHIDCNWTSDSWASSGSTQTEKYDYYSCTLMVSNESLTSCSGTFPIELFGKSGGYIFSDAFDVTATTQPLGLSLSITSIDPNSQVDCQIVDKQNTCIPKQPQRVLKAKIESTTGVDISELKLLGSMYRINNLSASPMVCRPESSDTTYKEYKCNVFISAIPVTSLLQHTEEMNITFDARYVNYYESISASTTTAGLDLSYQATNISETVDTMKVIEEKQSNINKYIKIFEKLEKIAKVLNYIGCCCGFGNIIEKIYKDPDIGNILNQLKRFAGEALYGSGTKNTAVKVINAVANLGLKFYTCFYKSYFNILNDKRQDLMDFQNTGASPPLEHKKYGFDDIITRGDFYSCIGSAFWNGVSSCLLCGFIMFAIRLIFPVVNSICVWIGNPWVSAGLAALQILIVVFAILLFIKTYKDSNAILHAADAGIETQIKVQNAVTDYAEAYANATADVLESTVASQGLENLFPTLPTVKFYINSTTQGLLDYNETVCRDEEIFITYNFVKFNNTPSYTNQLLIKDNVRGWSNITSLPDLNGTLGPYRIGDLFQVSSPPPPLDISNEYDFLVSYGYGDVFTYKLYYDNTC
jgi:hypothetical protein